MDTLLRLKKVINWLIFQGIADSEKDLADKLGYTKSSFSQLVNGRVPLSDKFVGKLCSLDKNINKVWLVEGSGKMFADDDMNGELNVVIPRSVWTVIQQQSESLAARDRQIDELISILKNQIIRMGGPGARVKDVDSPAAG